MHPCPRPTDHLLAYVMVVEYIRYKVPTSRHREFEEAWSDAQQVLTDAPQCLGDEISHGLEEPENYVVRIEWRSVEEHEQGFRGSSEFARFFEAVKPFFEQIEEMRHYEPTGIEAGDEQR
jgi:heme-degrading monooxygenase HmoA